MKQLASEEGHVALEGTFAGNQPTDEMGKSGVIHLNAIEPVTNGLEKTLSRSLEAIEVGGFGNRSHGCFCEGECLYAIARPIRTFVKMGRGAVGAQAFGR